jgi:hypothetical protein
MKKSNTERIDSVIQQFMRINGIETPYNQYKLIQAWPEVMGEYIAQHTDNIFIKNQTLHVHITSPAIKQNLLLEHRAIAQRLNRKINAQVIEDILFY